MKDWIKITLFCIGTILTAAAIGFVAQGTDFFAFKFWAPKYENAKREVFENTKSYRQGTAQDIRRMQEEYLKADADHKQALRSLILHKTADLDLDSYPEDIQAFVHSLERE